MFLKGLIVFSLSFFFAAATLGSPLESPLSSSRRPLPRPAGLKPPPPRIPVLPDEGADAPSTGVALLDQALRGERPPNLLPFWFGYPWAKIKTPVLWTKHLVEELRAEKHGILKIDVKDADLFCPNFPQLNEEQRVAFWTRLVSLLMEQESTFDPLSASHSADVQFGLYSSGLLMLSIQSSKQKRFDCSMIETESDLFHWRKNVSCAVRIMGHYVSEDRVIASRGRPSAEATDERWMGLPRYWEPFRDGRLQSEETRGLLLRFVRQNRKTWIEEGRKKSHPAYADEEYKKAGEKRLTRILRLMNQMEFCPTGRADDFEEASVIPTPRPRPRPALGARPPRPDEGP